jgi:hypothetical protein
MKKLLILLILLFALPVSAQEYARMGVLGLGGGSVRC